MWWWWVWGGGGVVRCAALWTAHAHTKRERHTNKKKGTTRGGRGVWNVRGSYCVMLIKFMLGKVCEYALDEDVLFLMVCGAFECPYRGTDTDNARGSRATLCSRMLPSCRVFCTNLLFAGVTHTITLHSHTFDEKTDQLRIEAAVVGISFSFLLFRV